MSETQDKPAKKPAPQIVCRVSAKMLDKIEKEAERIDRTKTEVVLRALEAYFSKPKKP